MIFSMIIHLIASGSCVNVHLCLRHRPYTGIGCATVGDLVMCKAANRWFHEMGSDDDGAAADEYDNNDDDCNADYDDDWDGATDDKYGDDDSAAHGGILVLVLLLLKHPQMQFILPLESLDVIVQML